MSLVKAPVRANRALMRAQLPAPICCPLGR